MDALDFMVEMANEDCTPSDSLATASTESQELFNNGKVAMQFCEKGRCAWSSACSRNYGSEKDF